MERRRPLPKIREPVPSSKRRRLDTDDAPASSSACDEGDGDDCDGDSNSTRPMVKASKPDPEKLAQELEQAILALENLKKKNKQLERKCQTAQAAKVRLVERHAVQVASLRAKKEAILENFLKDLPVVPATLFKILMRTKKWINWDTQKEAMELCLAVYFRSNAAYAVLRSVGFQLPHPRTLRRRFSRETQLVFTKKSSVNTCELNLHEIGMSDYPQCEVRKSKRPDTLKMPSVS